MSRSALTLLIAILIFTCGCSGSNPLVAPERTDETSSLGIPYSPNSPVIPGMHPGEIGPGTDIRDLPQYIEGEVLIVLNEDVKPAFVAPIAEELQLSLIKKIHLRWADVFRMKIDSSASVEETVSTLLEYTEVRYAEPNYILYNAAAPYYPNDPLFEYSGDLDNDPWDHKRDQWGPNVLGASLCWPTQRGSADVVVAVLDTGYRYTHEDLANQIWINEDEIPDNGIDDDDNGWIDDWRGWDSDQGDNDPWDNYGHGTACSGVVAAEQDNGLGCTGIAPGVKIMALRCDLMGGGGYTSSVIEGIEYAHVNGADIVSMSFRTYNDSQIMHNTFIDAYEDGEGLLPVGGAGNENSSELTYPACWPEVVEVGGTCSFYRNGNKRRDVQRIQPNQYGWGSNWGVNLEVMAPGALYITTKVGSDQSYYDGGSGGFFGGTSNATPCAAASFALLKSEFPEMNAADLRQRMNETCDDLYDPGFDIQSGWGRINIWRALYGSDPNTADYDVNDHIPITPDDTWYYDNIFDISTSADYDFEDIFVVTAEYDGALVVDVDIITTGEDLDVAVYSDLAMTNMVESSIGPNGENNPWASIHMPVAGGETYYLRVYSPEPNNCSNFRIKVFIEEAVWNLQWESIAPIFVMNSSNNLPFLKLDFTTNLEVTVDQLKTYIAGDVPLNLVNSMMIYEDSDSSGTFNVFNDTLLQQTDMASAAMNQSVFTGLGVDVTWDSPKTLFLIGDIGPNELGENVNVGAGIRTYKDLGVQGGLPLGLDPMPFQSDLTVLGEDHEPPIWDTTVGIQETEAKFGAVKVFWNSATDLLSEPTGYNLYWDDNSPPDIVNAESILGIIPQPGGDYDYSALILGLSSDLNYHFLVRAEDALGNEDENEIWLSRAPDTEYDPTDLELIGSIDLPGDSWEVSVHEKIAYLASGSSGIQIVDCTSPQSPVVIGTYPGSSCYGIQYHETQNYVYASNSMGLVIVDPNADGGPSLVGSFAMAWAWDVYVDGDTCYLGDWYGKLQVLDVSNPAAPVALGSTTLGTNQTIYGLTARDGYAYACTASQGLKIIDATDPASPSVVKTLNLNSYTYEIQLWGDYACVTNWSNEKFFVIDITDPPNAFKAGEMDIAAGYGAGVAIRDDQYVYIGAFPSSLATLRWDDVDNISEAHVIMTNGPDGLFFDGTLLYAAENAAGLKIFL